MEEKEAIRVSSEISDEDHDEVDVGAVVVKKEVRISVCSLVNTTVITCGTRTHCL
jgi:hypothetical protein